MSYTRYKHILFDLDGTIFDTHFANMDALYEVLHKYNPQTTETTQSLGRLFGIPGVEAVKELGIADADKEQFFDQWVRAVAARAYSVKIFDGILATLQFLQDKGYHLGIITSRQRTFSDIGGDLGDFLPLSIRKFFNPTRVICSDDVAKPKPYPDSILRYMQITGAKPYEILFIGDAKTDLMCAQSAGVDFALALWGYCQQEHLICSHYLKNPYDLVTLLNTIDNDSNAFWYKLGSELCAIAQNGLSFCHDIYDKERYERLMQISSVILASHGQIEPDSLCSKMLCEIGYQTPKIDTRAAVFNDKGQVLLVQEKSGLWSLPGGYCDNNESLVSNTLKELKEEAGFSAHIQSLIAILVRNKHNVPSMPFGMLKVFMLGLQPKGEFVANSETIDCRFFSKDELPSDEMLRLSTTTKEQLYMCFAAYENKNFSPIIE